jgi:biopolymer transport protein ExbD
MAGGGANLGKGNRKSLDFDLNLTSFIDLLSTITCFLLISAVWVQIGTMEIKQSHGTDVAAAPKEALDLDMVFKGPTEIKLNLKKNGKAVKSLEVKADSYETMLTKLNETIKTQVLGTANKIAIGTATLTPKTGVNYGQMVGALDVLRKNKIVNIGVLTERGQ